jgi:hypothetical protein
MRGWIIEESLIRFWIKLVKKMSPLPTIEGFSRTRGDALASVTDQSRRLSLVLG